MKVTRKSRVAVAGLAAAGLALSLFSVPSSAATRSTVVMVTSNNFSSLNTSIPGGNLVFNTEVAYLTSMGWNYYNDKAALIKNPIFGNYKISKNTETDFRTTWTVNKGLLWSDGTPIDAADMLLGHIVSSDAYSKAAGLGDPTNPKDSPAFNSLGYGGTYSEAIVGDPIIASNNLGVTLKFKSKIPDWDLTGPGLFPAHTLVRLAEGKKTLGTLKENLAAKAKFVKAFKTKDTALLKKMGEIWSTQYKIADINTSTNPLLLVNNGAYLVKNSVAKQSITLVANPKYNSGPKTKGIKTLVFRIIGDGTAAAQALANREVDLYMGQPTADTLFLLKSVVGIGVKGYSQGAYEHVDLRTGTSQFTPDDPYTGIFAGNSAKAVDLRTATLLAWPREEIVTKLVKTINPNSVVLDSVQVFPAEANYKAMTSGSGISKYAGTQDERTAKALALVKKYFPNASATNPGFTINLLWGTPTNQRRTSEAQLVIAALAKAGIKVTAPGNGAWPDFLDSADYDAAFYAWSKSANVQLGSCAQYESTGGNNSLGYKNATLDAACDRLKKQLPAASVLKEWITVEKEIYADALTLPIFQHPGVVAYRTDLKGIKPGPLSPNVLWNFWEWSY